MQSPTQATAWVGLFLGGKIRLGCDLEDYAHILGAAVGCCSI